MPLKKIESVDVVYTMKNGMDWQAIYINGKIAQQGEGLKAGDLFHFLSKDGYMRLGPIGEYWVDEEWMFQVEQLPARFAKIPQDVVCNYNASQKMSKVR